MKRTVDEYTIAADGGQQVKSAVQAYEYQSMRACVKADAY